MLGRGSDDDGMSQEEMMELQAEQEQERSQEQLANNIVGQATGEFGAAAPGYWSMLGSPDVDRDENDELEDFIATEVSDKFALGQIKYDDWESWNWRTENEFWVMKNEFKDPDSNLDSLDMATMGFSDRPELDNEKARRLRGAMQVKKMLTSLAVDARGLRSGTEIHAVTKSEQGENENTDEDQQGGYISKTKSWLSR